jgi:hypothetical protein
MHDFQIFFRGFFSFFFVQICMLLILVACLALATSSYPNWMSQFQSYKLGDLPLLPGTHDSGAFAVSELESWLGIAGWLYAQTQETTLSQQLNLGIRVLDIRLYVTYDAFDEENSIYVSHTFRSNLTYAGCLAEVAEFLTENPTEFVYLLVRIDEAHLLQENQETKMEFIESVMLDSDVQWADIDSEKLKTLTVNEVAGKVILIAKDTVLPENSEIPHLSHGINYDVCDVFQYSNQYSARQRIGACFPAGNPSTTQTGVLYGFALDGQFDQLWPNITSRQMNDWFFYNFEENPTWVSRKESAPVGILLIDFVNIDYATKMIQYNMDMLPTTKDGFRIFRYSLNIVAIITIIHMLT